MAETKKTYSGSIGVKFSVLWNEPNCSKVGLYSTKTNDDIEILYPSNWRIIVRHRHRSLDGALCLNLRGQKAESAG